MEIPTFEIIFNDDNDIGIEAMSLVDQPAIEVDVLMLSKQIKIEKFELNQKEKTVIGPYLIPNKFITRLDKNDNEYNIFFNKDTIKKFSDLMFKNQTFNNINLMHSNEKPDGDNYIIEHWIKEDMQHDKSNQFKNFKSLPIGTAFIKYKLDDVTYSKFENNELNGFSIELMLNENNYKSYKSKEDKEKEKKKKNKMENQENKFQKLFSQLEEFFTVKDEVTEVESKADLAIVKEKVTTERIVDEPETELQEEVIEDAPTDESSDDVSREEFDELVSRLDAIEAAIMEMTQTTEEMSKSIKRIPSTKPIESQKPTKQLKEMTLAEEMAYKLSKYKNDF